MDKRTSGQLDRQWEKQTGGHPASLSFLVSVKLGWTLGISRLPLDLCPLPSVLCPFALSTVTAAQLFALMAAPTAPTGF